MYCNALRGSASLLASLMLANAAIALPVESAVDQALARDAGLNELRQRADAIEQRSVADRALPDPELTLGAEGLPINDPLSSDMMTIYRIGVRQRFPAGDTRRLNGELGTSLAGAVEIEARSRRLEVALQTRLAWLSWAAAAESAAGISAMLEQVEGLLEIFQRRFATGSERHQDESQARLELILMKRRRLDAATAIDESLARLQRWTGLFQQDQSSPKLPEWTRPDHRELDSRTRLAAHPELAAARMRVEAGQLSAEIARQAYRPEWMIEAGYGHQRGDDPMGGRMSDKLFVMATVSLPLFAANRQDRRVDAALADRDAEEAQAQLILQRLSGELDEQLALRQRLEERRQLLEAEILPQAKNTLDATASAYETDRASFDELVRARLQLFELELDLINTRERLLATIARIAALTNEEPS